MAQKLPDNFKQVRPEIDRVGIDRVRNLIARHYDKVDDRLVFAALERRVPDLLERLGL